MVITIDKESLEYINRALSEKVMDEDEIIVYTAKFDDGAEMDIKVCGCDEEPAYTEAVLFKNGYEIACTDCADEILGEWELHGYVVNVEAK